MKYCQRVTEWISQAKERELSWLEKNAIHIHLLFCPSCRNFQQNCYNLSKMMRQFAQPDKQEKE